MGSSARGKLRQMEVKGTLNLPNRVLYPVQSRELAIVPIATSSIYKNCNLDATTNCGFPSLFFFNLLVSIDFPPYSGEIVCLQTTQELRLLSSVTINCQVTKIVMNSVSQMSQLSRIVFVQNCQKLSK